MDDRNLELAASLVEGAYIEQGARELRIRNASVRALLSQRSLPELGWEDAQIEWFLSQLAAMDSNNFSDTVGVGEREGRIGSAVVYRRHFGFGHGVGRSGDVEATQPKAAGSSLIYKLTNRLALHAVQVCGITRAASALVLPLATGMSLALVLATLKAERPVSARYVLWPRVDQKSCFKAMLTAGCTPVVIENVLVGDELHTDMRALLQAVVDLGGPDAIVAVLSTTSCFAPRGCDRVDAIAMMCAQAGIPHVINHAYGLQSSKLCHEVNEACRLGRVDAVVSSTDKNFCVPVGGAVVVSPAPEVITAVSRMYPGRASLSPILDLFILLLSWGREGLLRELAQRKECNAILRSRLAEVAAAFGERLLATPRNPISVAMTLAATTTMGWVQGTGGSGGVGRAGGGAAPHMLSAEARLLSDRSSSGSKSRAAPSLTSPTAPFAAAAAAASAARPSMVEVPAASVAANDGAALRITAPPAPSPDAPSLPPGSGPAPSLPPGSGPALPLSTDSAEAPTLTLSGGGTGSTSRGTGTSGGGAGTSPSEGAKVTPPIPGPRIAAGAATATPSTVSSGAVGGGTGSPAAPAQGPCLVGPQHHTPSPPLPSPSLAPHHAQAPLLLTLSPPLLVFSQDVGAGGGSGAPSGWGAGVGESGGPAAVGPPGSGAHLSRVASGVPGASLSPAQHPSVSGSGGSGSPPRSSRQPLGATYLGSMLFSRGVSGTRVVAPGPSGHAPTTIGPHAFAGFGAHCDAYPLGPYLTSAAAIGISPAEVDVYADRLRRAMVEFKRQQAGRGGGTAAQPATTRSHGGGSSSSGARGDDPAPLAQGTREERRGADLGHN